MPNTIYKMRSANMSFDRYPWDPYICGAFQKQFLIGIHSDMFTKIAIIIDIFLQN